MDVCSIVFISQTIVWLPISFKISSFAFNRRKKLTGLEQLEGELMTKFLVLGELSLYGATKNVFSHSI